MSQENTTETKLEPQGDLLDRSVRHHRLVSAAMLMEDGMIVPGVRHYSPEMRLVLRAMYGDGYRHKVKEQGFIDTHGNFLDRKAAWRRCEETQQFHRTVSTEGTLYSENLY